MDFDYGDLPPGAKAAVLRFESSMADLETAGARLRADAEEAERPFHGVDEEFLTILAADPHASPQLRECAAAIGRGEYIWADVVAGHRPQPVEIERFAANGIPFSFATFRRPAPTEPALVDDEDEGPPDSWLE